MKVIHQNNIIKESGNIVSRFRNITHSITERRNNMTHAFMIMFLSFVGMFLGFIIMPLALSSITNSVVFAESFQSQEDVTFTFVPTVNISISGDLIISDLATSSTSDSNQITVTTSSNNAVGYTLGSTVGSSSNASTELRKDGTSTTTKFSSITTNKATLASFSDSNWGYSYSTDNGSNWKSGDITGTTQAGYNGLPIYTSSSPIKLINSNTNGSNSVKFKIGAKASSSQIAGTYTNTINFIGVPKVIATTYTISYNDPSGEATNMPTQQGGTDTTGYGAINISSTQPTRSNYLFKGWCTAQTTDDTCSGDTIKPGHLLALNPGTSSMTPSVTKTLYAMWRSSVPPTLQDATLADCGKTMYDSRDTGTETEYTTALIGGQCWMTTNLNLAGGTALSADDTDVTSSYISSFTTSNNLTKSGNTIVLPASTTDSGFDTDNYSYVANSGNASSNCSNAPGCYSYYSWDAATLGSGRALATDNTNAEQSICPKGWHLPTTYNGNPNNSTDFRKLVIALGGSSSIQLYNSSTTPTGATMSSALQASPNNFLLAGRYYSGSLANGGSDGYYWSSTSYTDNSTARFLYFYSSFVNPANNIRRSMGNSVRCVMTPTMQSVDASTLASMMPNVGDTAALRDERDDQEYLIGKLADGNYWMLDNLRLGGSSTMSLTPADTNITSNWTLPASTTTGFTDDTTGYTQPAINADYKNTTTTSYGAGSGKIGNYYNYCSASAGTYCYASGSGTGNAQHDICPAGWRMPTGASSGEYQALYTAYSSDATSFRNALSTPLSGYFSDGSARSQGSYGRFWSSTYDNGNNMYSLNVDSSDVYPTSSSTRYRGYSLRCILDS